MGLERGRQARARRHLRASAVQLLEPAEGRVQVDRPRRHNQRHRRQRRRRTPDKHQGRRLYVERRNERLRSARQRQPQVVEQAGHGRSAAGLGRPGRHNDKQGTDYQHIRADIPAGCAAEGRLRGGHQPAAARPGRRRRPLDAAKPVHHSQRLQGHDRQLGHRGAHAV